MSDFSGDGQSNCSTFGTIENIIFQMDKKIAQHISEDAYLSASFIKSEAGSEPGLRMNTIGDMALLCSKMASKLMTGGCTYFSPTLDIT